MASFATQLFSLVAGASLALALSTTPSAHAQAAVSITRDSVTPYTIGDSTKDSVVFEFTSKGFHRKKRTHTFLITDLEDGRQEGYIEPFSMIDFNRTDGFFLGLGSSTMTDFGKYDELGVKGGVGYGFENKAWQYFFGAEYRLPLERIQTKWMEDTVGNTDSVARKIFSLPHTLAIGGEIHNQTSTDDAWRVSRMENAADAFFAREDFHDYYKIAGYNAYIAYRPHRNVEAKVEWRNDHYESRNQEVFYGRFGGNKRLPVNPPVQEGQMRSIVATLHEELAKEHHRVIANLLGDSVKIEELRGPSTLLQGEFGKLSGSDFSFNRYTADVRYFWPVAGGLAFDNRIRYQATFGDVPYQKAEFLGGPSTLPAYKNKTVGDVQAFVSDPLSEALTIAYPNRMLLWNSEVRIHLALLSSYFSSQDMQFVINNDFGWIATADPATGETADVNKFSLDHLKYNVGFGLGWVSGIQLGVSWRTDVKSNARFTFRLQRPF